MCAVSDGAVPPAGRRRSTRRRSCSRSRDERVDGVMADIRAVARRSTSTPRATSSSPGSRSRLARLRRRAPRLPPRVLCVEWLDAAVPRRPLGPRAGGGGRRDTMWVPRRAAIRRQREWDAAAALRPDLIAGDAVRLRGGALAGRARGARDPAAERRSRRRRCGCSTATPTPLARGHASWMARSCSQAALRGEELPGLALARWRPRSG